MHLARGLRTLGYNVDIYEQRQLSKFLRIRRNKTDAGDAIGIADAGRLGASTVSRVHLKDLECQRIQSRLAIRRLLVRQRVASTNLLKRQLELYGGRLRGQNLTTLRSDFEAAIRNVFGRVENDLTRELRSLVDYCEHLIDYQRAADIALRRLAIGNEVCRRFMEIPGVGPIGALTFYAVVSEPHRFTRTARIGSYLGLTPQINQSGMSLRIGRISKMGNASARSLLVGASTGFIKYSVENSYVRAWALSIEGRRGRKKARVALARKLATIMLAIWKSGKPYRPQLISVPRKGKPDDQSVELDFGRPSACTQRVNENETNSAVLTKAPADIS